MEVTTNQTMSKHNTNLNVNSNNLSINEKNTMGHNESVITDKKNN